MWLIYQLMQKLEASQKAKSGSAYNWNTLFVRADTVASATALAHGVSKGDLLNPVRVLFLGYDGVQQWVKSDNSINNSVFIFKLMIMMLMLGSV